MLKTVGQLRAELADMDNDTPLMHYVGFGLMEDGLDMRVLRMVDVIDDAKKPLTSDNIASIHEDDPILKDISEDRILSRYIALGTQSWK